MPMRHTLVAIAALSLAACGPTSPATSSTSGSTPTPRATYDDVQQLKTAATDAGLPCPEWDQSNAVELAATSGTCSSSNVMSVFLSKDLTVQSVQRMKSLPFGGNLLVGQNWIINDDLTTLEKIKPALGGQIVSWKGR